MHLLLVENMALAGRPGEAVALVECMLRRPTPLGLYAEEALARIPATFRRRSSI